MISLDDSSIFFSLIRDRYKWVRSSLSPASRIKWYELKGQARECSDKKGEDGQNGTKKDHPLYCIQLYLYCLPFKPGIE